jgi:hypothetical protein
VTAHLQVRPAGGWAPASATKTSWTAFATTYAPDTLPRRGAIRKWRLKYHSPEISITLLLVAALYAIASGCVALHGVVGMRLGIAAGVVPMMLLLRLRLGPSRA